MVEQLAEGLAWQVGVWNRMADVYQQEIDSRFQPIVTGILDRADLKEGEAVLDLGTGTGSVALAAAAKLGPKGRVLAVDISAEMLEKARARFHAHRVSNITTAEGKAEEIPAEDGSVDAVLASLSLMYVVDRAAAAGEIARVLRPGGRLIASVWAGAEDSDIVRFQQTAGSFAPKPPVAGVGPGALAEPALFLSQLKAAGLEPSCGTVITGFQFTNFHEAWDALAGVTTSALEPDVRRAAKLAVQTAMWPDPDAPRAFRNATQFITAVKQT